MFEDLEPKKTTDTFPKNLDNLSVSDLQEYIHALEQEIVRVHEDIKRKKASQDAAASIFK